MSEQSGYSVTEKLRYAHCDLSGHLSLSQMFLFLQDVAVADSDRLGIGTRFVDEYGIFWVLSRVALKVYQPPALHQRIRIETYHGKTVRYVFPRYFTIDDEEGNRLVEASSLWMLIGREDRQIVFPALRGFDLPEPPDRKPVMDAPGKISLPFEPDVVTARSPVYSDFDGNGHMNNARYPLWICDLFDPGLYSTHFVDSLQLNYVHEITAGEPVDIAYGLRDGAFAVRGMVAGDSRFEAAGTFARY